MNLSISVDKYNKIAHFEFCEFNDSSQIERMDL